MGVLGAPPTAPLDPPQRLNADHYGWLLTLFDIEFINSIKVVLHFQQFTKSLVRIIITLFDILKYVTYISIL